MRTRKQKAPEKIDRQKTHGGYGDQALVCGEILAALYSTGAVALDPSKQHALMMIAVKLSRILTGDPNHIDHWADIAGYCERVIEGIKEGK